LSHFRHKLAIYLLFKDVYDKKITHFQDEGV